MAFTIVWNVDADGSWGTAADWSPQRLPGSSDDVDIDTADLHLVRLGSTASVHSLTVGNDNFSIQNGGSLTVAAGATFANALSMGGGAGGTLALGSSTASVAGLFTMTNGTLSGTATFTAAGGASFSLDPVMTGAGTTILEGTVSMTNASLYLDGGRVLENEGTSTATTTNTANSFRLGSRPTGSGNALGDATLQNDASGTINFDSSVDYIGVYAGAGTTQFTNAGVVENTGSGTTEIDTPFANTGTLSVAAGEIDLNGGGSSSGTITVASGATLAFAGNAYTLNNNIGGSGAFVVHHGVITETVALTLGGAASLGGGTFSVTSGASFGSTLGMFAGTLALGAGTGSVTGLLTDDNATLSGTGSFTAAGGASFGGTDVLMTGSGTTILQGTTSLATGNGLSLDGGRILENEGSLTAATDGSGFNLGHNPFGTAVGGATLQNDASGTIDFDYASSGIGVSAGYGTTLFSNAGLVENTGAGTTAIDSPFSNTGTLSVASGEIDLDGGGSSSGGSITVASGTKLLFDGSGTTFSSGTAITGSGTLEIDSGTVSLSVTDSFAGGLVMGDGTLAGTGTFTAEGGGLFNGYDGLITGSGTTILEGSTTLATHYGLGIDGGRILENQGTVTDTSSSGFGLGYNPYGTNVGGGTLQNDATGTIDFDSDDDGDGVFVGSGTTLFSNAGLVENTGTGLTKIRAPFTNTGTLSVVAGAIDLEGGGSSSGTVMVASGATLYFNRNGGSGADFTLNDTIGGSGAVEIDYGTATATVALAFGGAVTIGGGTLSATAGASFGGTLTLTGGTLAVSHTVSVTGLFTEGEATVSGTGTFTAAGGALFNGGDELMSGSGRTVLQDTTSITSSDGLSLDGGRILENEGTLTNTSGEAFNLGYDPFAANVGAATLQNDASGTIDFDYGSFDYGVYAGSGTVAFTNAGLVENTGAGTTAIYSSFTNTGTLSVAAGDIDLDGGGSSSGSISVAGGAVLDFNGGTFTASSNKLTGTGLIELSTGTLNLAARTSFGGALTLSGATLGITGGSATFGGQVTVGDLVTFAGPGGLIAAGGAVFQNGNQLITGSTMLLEGTSSATNDNLYLDGGANLENKGSFTLTAVSLRLGDNPFTTTLGGGILDNTAAGTLTFNDNITIQAVTSGSGKTEILNAGTIDVTGSATTELDAAIANSGTIAVMSGTLLIDGIIAGGGTITVASGASFTFDGTSGTDSLFISSGSGAVSLTGGSGKDTFRFGSNLQASDTVNGGAGKNTLILDGDYSAGFTFGASTMQNISVLTLVGGHSYNLTTNDANVAAHAAMTVDGRSLGAGDALIFNGAAESDAHFNIDGGAGNDSLTGGAGNDVFNLSEGGTDTASGGAGGDTFNMGGALVAADHIDGGKGNDTVALDGNYAGGFTFGATTMVNVENLDLAGGFSYALTTNDATVAAGQTLTVDAAALHGGDTLIFDGSAETNGSFAVQGGNGNDVLTGGAGNDTLDGGVGVDTADYHTATGNLTVALGAPGSASGAGIGSDTLMAIENVTGGSGNDVITGDSNSNLLLGGAGNDSLAGNAGSDTLEGGAGADALNGGTGADTFLYASASDSTSTAYDTITGFAANQDLIDVPGAVTAIDATIKHGTLSTATFDADLAAAVNATKLGADHAVVFTPDAGTLSGQVFLVIDTNGSAGYQAGQDLVIDLVSAGNLSSLSTADFV